MRTFQEGAAMQVATVTRNLELAIAPHWEKLRIGPWEIFDIDTTKFEHFFYRGEPATFTFRIGVAWAGDTQLEIIQPLTGYSIYNEHLDKQGEGLHHYKIFHSDCRKVVAEYAERGYAVLQCGKIDEDEHYYLDTAKDLGYILEIGNAGRIGVVGRKYPS
jgi:methylmalonyl-CoA/ethylmalonyl-CoA epimerase